MVVLIITLSVLMSIDAMAVGIAYGIKNIKIPLSSTLTIGFCSILFGSVSIWFGSRLTMFLPTGISKWIGIIILLSMGTWFLMQNIIPEKTFKEKTTLLNLVIKSMGITITIVKDPLISDMDHSGIIDFKESLVVGCALAMDILGAGLGIGATDSAGFIMPVSVGICQTTFIYIGLIFGKKIGYMSEKISKLTGYFPGIILIAIAFFKIWF